jgi:hypothetical protein
MSVQGLSIQVERATHDACWRWTSTHSLHVTAVREVFFEVTALIVVLESHYVAFDTPNAPSLGHIDLPVVHR